MPGTMSVGGLMSGLQTDEIVAKVMDYARRPRTRLLEQKALEQQRLTAWQDINTRVLALRTRSEAVADALDFQAMTASSSDTDLVTATASTSAAPGTYYLKVISRARSHQVSSQAEAYTSLTDVVGTGSVNIQLANGAGFSVTLDSGNNTLSGLRDAINAADDGVKATIINAGTTTSPDYRMLLTSTESGTANAITVVNTTGLSGGTAPTFSLAGPVQAAADAVVEFGEGLGKITVTKSSNAINDLIPGVSLSIIAADTNTTVTIEVARNTSAVRSAIDAFVAQYNDLANAIDDQFEYDTQTGETLPLFSDFRLQTVQSDIIGTLMNRVTGLSSSISALAGIGITQDTTGQLVIDDTTLSDALDGNMEAVARLFGAGIDTTSSYVSYLASTADTRPSGLSGWEVDITQAARRAQVTAGAAMTDPLASDETLTVDGQAISLTAGMVIDDVVERINSYSSQTNVMALKTGADGTGDGNYITFRRVQYGDGYDVTVVSNLSYGLGDATGVGNVIVTAADPEGETGIGQGMVGLDVAGAINGQAATGSGQILTLSSTTTTNDAKGLSLLVTATEPLSDITIKYTKGVGAALREMLVGLTSTTGAITEAQNSINSAITQIDADVADLEARLADQEARLYAQFNTLETQLARLQQQGNYLAAQFSAMNKSK